MGLLVNAEIVKEVFYVAVPILKPVPVNCIDEEIEEYILGEIDALNGSFVIDDVTIEYRSVHDIEHYNHITQRILPKHIRPYKMFVFEMIASKQVHLLKPFEDKEHGVKISSEENFVFSTFSDLSIYGYALAYALGIHCDGLFDIDLFIVYYDEKLSEKKDGLLNLFYGLHEKDDSFCLCLRNVSLQKTLNWFLSIDDVLNSCGKTALGKSLSIYSRMFSSNNSDEDFFMCGLFAVMALEALYESHGKINDLSEKMAKLLNIDKEKCKSDVKRIYKHRCSVAHGGFEFPFKFNAHDGSDDFMQSFETTWNSVDLGLLYLFKSFRKMIFENKKELSFSYKCL